MNWDWHIYTMDKIDNEWKPPVQHKELYLMHRGDLDEKEVKGRGYVLITADSLCSTPENNTSV